MAGRFWVGVTDADWFNLLRAIPDVDEVNFWQPSPVALKALQPGAPFLFKLHRDDRVVGGGFFADWTHYPVSIAWEAFGQKNGVASLAQMRARIERYRRLKPAPHEDYEIGCIMLEQPFFFDEDDRVRIPDWQPNIVRGKGYALAEEPGQSLWSEVSMRLQARGLGTPAVVAEPVPRYGEPTLVRPRLGQGSFRLLVRDAYERRCAATGEKVLPVLEAAHIRPYEEGGEHRIDNGLLLRSDLHKLFDKGYVTVTPEHRLEVSRRLESEFNNGKEYLALHGRGIVLPQNPADTPAREFLEWHNENRFVA